MRVSLSDVLHCEPLQTVLHPPAASDDVGADVREDDAGPQAEEDDELRDEAEGEKDDGVKDVEELRCEGCEGFHSGHSTFPRCENQRMERVESKCCRRGNETQASRYGRN